MSEREFVERQKELFSLFGKGNMNDASSLIGKIKAEFPKRLDKIIFWEACVLSNQGKADEAIAALQEGLKEGIWWNPYILTADKDLQNLQTHHEFKKIVLKCEEILNSQQKGTAAELFIYGHPQSEIGIFSMHARGTNVKDFAPYWLSEKGETSYLLGFPQSSQIFGCNAYCWDDQGSAINDIKQAFKTFREKYPTKSAIIGGASQGGKLSIELCLGSTLPEIKGFIAVMPAVKDAAAIETLLEETNHSDLRGCIIIGDQDPFYKNNLQLIQILEANHIDCKLIVKDGLNHFFPEDFPQLLSEAVEFILR